MSITEITLLIMASSMLALALVNTIILIHFRRGLRKERKRREELIKGLEHD